MKLSSICSLVLSLLFIGSIQAQQPATRLNSPGAYATGRPIANEAAAALDATFEEINVGLLNVYAMQTAGDDDTYLLEGKKIAGEYLDLFPGRYRRMARRADTDIYAAATVKGDGEALYIVRTVSGKTERIDLFDLEGETMKHLRTIAYYNCVNGKCNEVESYLTDLDRDGRLDVAQIYRSTGKNGNVVKSGERLYLMTTDGKFKRTKMDLEPTMRNSLKFHDQ